MTWSYKDFCPRYHEGCFKCPDYLGTEALFFCRKANLERFGVEHMELAVWTDDDGAKHVTLAKPVQLADLAPNKQAAAWWNGRNKKKGEK